MKNGICRRLQIIGVEGAPIRDVESKSSLPDLRVLEDGIENKGLFLTFRNKKSPSLRLNLLADGAP